MKEWTILWLFSWTILDTLSQILMGKEEKIGKYITKSSIGEINEPKLPIATSKCKEVMNTLDMKGTS